MSKQWWETGAHSTQGHGICSQNAAELQKEWIGKEFRRQGRATSPEKVFKAGNSLYKNSLSMAYDVQPLEHRHWANSKTLAQLRALQAGGCSAGAPDSPGRQSNRPRSPASSVGRPQTGGHHLPHLEHHAHFGWNPPLPGGGQQPGKVQSTALKYGQALQYNQDVTHKIQLLSTRHV